MGVRRWSALIVAAALLAAGCGSGDGDRGADGLKRTAGFDGRTIKVGVLAPLSGPGAVVGIPLAAGGRLWLDSYNAERGGIAGRYEVELVERDHRVDPPTALQGYNRLKSEVALFSLVQGTSVINALLPQLRRDDKAAVPGSLDAEWIREPNLIPLLAPYQVEAINAMDFYLRGEGRRRDKAICTLVQNDTLGEAGQDGVEFAARQLDFEIATTARFRFMDRDYTGQIEQLRQADCDMVFLAATPADVGTILSAAAQVRFAPRWIGLVTTWVDALARSPLKPYLERTFWVVGEGPEYGDRSVRGMRELLARLRKYPPGPKIVEGDPFLRFGYAAAQVTTAVLEQAVGNRDLSSEGILRAITELRTVSFGGLFGDYRYGPVDRREPPRVSTMFKVDADKPYGLEALQTNFSSAAARKYRFPGG